MSRVVITGGSGYIGDWLAKRLMSEGSEVTVIDVLKPDFKVDTFVKANVRRLGIMLASLGNCDYVYHMAAVVSKLRAAEDRWNAIETNVIGTLNILEACRILDIPKLIHVSTSEVLGDPIYLPTDEQHPRNPKTTYGLTKCAAEDLCREYARTYGLKIVIPRLYMIYGAEDYREIAYHSAIGKFVWAALHDIAPVAFKDCVRSWLHIEDCVDALMLLRNHGSSGEVYDITAPSSEKLSMVELASLIIRLCGKDLQPVVKEAPVWDTKVKLASGTKAYEALKWKPWKLLRIELPAFIDSWKKHLEIK